jgi:hypothetical protein
MSRKIKKKNLNFINNNYVIIYLSIYLQKVWRGYKIRKVIKNIYSRLPDDIQKIIKLHINKNLFIKRYNNSVLKIVNIRINMLDFLIDKINIFDLNPLYNYIDKIIDYIKTYSKYIDSISSATQYKISNQLEILYSIIHHILTEQLYIINEFNYEKYFRYFVNNEYNYEYINYLNKKNEIFILNSLYTIENLIN